MAFPSGRLSPPANPDGRLDSWKQIAAYLGRSERTVRRWQPTEGLPAHRHLHHQRGSVWAFRPELDEWLARRSLGPKPLASEAPAPAHASSRWLGVGIAAVILLPTVVLFFPGGA